MLLWIIAGYFAASALLYLCLRARCKKKPAFRPPKSKAAFYALSFTWGLAHTLFGCVVAAFLRVVKGYKAVRFGWARCIEIPGIRWGLELGVFFIAPPGDERLKRHEYGHGIQNIYLGIFFPAVVAIPSALRFWYRAIRQKAGRPCKTHYDDIWFEASATATGIRLAEIHDNEQREL